MNDKNIIIGVIVLLLAVGAILYATSDTASPTVSAAKVASGPNLPLAQCIADSGAVFYGAFWCSHCLSQKALFGDAVTALPYVECSTPDGNAQTAICAAKGIKGYPTWVFADGTTLEGEVSFVALAEKTGCSAFLPGTPSAALPVETGSSTD